MDYKKLLNSEIEEIRKIPVDRIEKLVNYIHENFREESHIITSGMGKAGQIAHTFSTTLSSTGSPSFFLHPSEAQHGDLGIIRKNDIIFIFSNSGKTREVLELIELIQNLNYNNKIIAIVGKSRQIIHEKCSFVLEFGVVEEICPMGLTPTTSTTCVSIICDLIVVGLIEKNFFTKEKYSKLHHGGYLNLKARGIINE